MSLRSTALLSVLAMAISWPLSAATFTYAFTGTDGTRFELDRPSLISPVDLLIETANNFRSCEVPEGPCQVLAIRPATVTAQFGNSDFLSFSNHSSIHFPDLAFSQPGTSLGLPGSLMDARLAVYEQRTDYAFEYYFKDSTGLRTFRYLSPRLLFGGTDLPVEDLDFCTATPGRACEAPQFNFDLLEFDAISFTESGLSFAYLFPRLAFSKPGIYETQGGANAGTLRLSYIRLRDGAPPPGSDPQAPVPEPASILLTATGLAAAALGLGARRGRRGCS